MPAKKNKEKQQYNCIAVAFQGGGALGSYQAGILRALDEEGYNPHWFVGTSIGAINAAIAAGNPEKVRVEKIYEFWESIATPTSIDPSIIANDPESRKLQHMVSAQSALLFGQPGFFTPRFPPPEWGWHNCPDQISYYDISPLRDTLEKFVDFDRINNNKIIRLSVGAVEICSGNMVYFDSVKQKITPEHIMASCALPPGFPAVKVDGKFYWDGGIASNSPVGYVVANQDHEHVLCFAVHLFDSYGLYPTTLDEVLMRKKDIEFSSRFSRMIELYKQVQSLKNSIKLLEKHVPEDIRKSPEMQLCCSKGMNTTIGLVRFLYEQDASELSSKDYEFSKKTIYERIEHGYRDGKKAIKKSPWKERISLTEGIAVYDMGIFNHLKGLPK